MFLRSFNTTSTALYLYANADILFDFGLIRTSLALLCASRRSNTTSDVNKEKVGYDVTNTVFDTGIFAVGRRTNIALKSLKSILPINLSQQHKNESFFSENAEDYFMTTAGGDIAGPNNTAAVSPSATGNSSGHFPWNSVPNFVIGRVGYDNWLVAQAIRWNITMAIDLTPTVLAVHQTGRDGIRSSLRRHSFGSNYKLAGRYSYYKLGVTNCLKWQSSLSLTGNITFLTRQYRQKICTRHEKGKTVKRKAVVKKVVKKPMIKKVK